jgi:signal transduction histidine kinase
MARIVNTLSGRVILSVMALHAVFLPAIYFALLRVTQESHYETFLNEVRSYARFLGDEIALSGFVEEPAKLKRLLDSAILSGHGVFAEIEVDGVVYASDLNGTLGPKHFRGEDFALGSGGDSDYYLAVPVDQGNHRAQLRLGFDETPIEERIAEVRRRILVILATYFALSVVLSVVLARLLARPLVELRAASRTVAAGDVARRVETSSRILEVKHLAEDIEFMRGELVKVSASLRQRQKLEELGTLAGGIAHEFNNVLVPIILFAEAALDELPPGTTVRSDVLQIKDAAQRAREVIRQIMFFSRRVDDGPNRPIQLEPVVRGTLQLMRTMVPANVELSVSLDPQAGSLAADPALIGQLVLNLCSNALQAMQPEGGSLSLTLAADTAGRNVRLVVEDTGHGMSEEVRARIFEPFFTTRPVGEGNGLGLSVVHGIVQSLGGTIRVESTPGRGSRFEILFPLGLERESTGAEG